LLKLVKKGIRVKNGKNIEKKKKKTKDEEFSKREIITFV